MGVDNSCFIYLPIVMFECLTMNTCQINKNRSKSLRKVRKEGGKKDRKKEGRKEGQRKEGKDEGKQGSLLWGICQV